ncbi:MAG: hypothetical protein D3926_04300 [Desulfobacteraceae bacterium]|nr:MAG: hypothetical protein D3926_04300 [Desulfobacteraceae bacterium]
MENEQVLGATALISVNATEIAENLIRPDAEKKHIIIRQRCEQMDILFTSSLDNVFTDCFAANRVPHF